MLLHDVVNLFDINMLAHGVGQDIELLRFVLRIVKSGIQRLQPFAQTQAVDQLAGEIIDVEQAVQISA